MTFFKDTQDTMIHLLTEVKRNADLQKQVVQRDVANSIGTLLSTLFIGVVVLLLVNTIFFFACVALAHVLGEALGCMAAGYAIVGGGVLVVLCIVYVCRNRWLRRPIMSMVQFSIGNTDSDVPTEELRQQLYDSRENIAKQVRELKESYDAPAGRFEKMARMATLGFRAYEGFRMGRGLLKSFSAVFGGKKKKKRR